MRSATWELRRIGVAESTLYPNFSLSAGGDFESLSVKHFLDWENRVLSPAALTKALGGGWSVN